MLYQLLRHPDSMNRLLKELYQTTVENSTSDDMPLPAWKSIRNLDYLDACFMEALRLHPPFCLPLERVVQRGGIMISGHYLPQGTVVGINPYVSNRNPSLFGKDVSEWRPERWIELDPAQRQRMERGVLSVGPWLPQYSVVHFLWLTLLSYSSERVVDRVWEKTLQFLKPRKPSQLCFFAMR